MCPTAFAGSTGSRASARSWCGAASSKRYPGLCQKKRGEPVRNRLVARAAGALVIVGSIAGCGSAETIPRHAARLTIDGNTHTARPPACSQLQGYRTIAIPDHDGQVE